jgi:hypothetical protein
MSPSDSPRQIVPELLRPVSGFSVSARKGRPDVVLFFDFEHPGAPGSTSPVAQIAMPADLLRRMHAVMGRALEHLDLAGPESDEAPLSLEDMPENVRMFPARPTCED